jgi:hypothetical protein
MDLFEIVKDMARRAVLNPAEPELPLGSTDANIDGFERRTGVMIPPMLRDWLKFTNGPGIGAGGTRGLRTPHPHNDIERSYGLHPEWLRRGWIPIAGDGCGDYYVVATRPEDGPGHPVLFIDCHIDRDRPTYVAGSDLLHFLEFYLGYELGERGWPFDREFVLRKDPYLALYTTVPKAWELDEERDATVPGK